MKYSLLFACIAALLFGTYGCTYSPFIQLYQGERLQPGEVATLFISGGVAVKKIDGNEPSVLKQGRIKKIWQYPEVLEVLPGPHKVKVSYESGDFLTTQPVTTLSLDAKAGHSYIIGLIIYVSKKTSGKSWRAVVIDKGLHYDEGVSPNPLVKYIDR